MSGFICDFKPDKGKGYVVSISQGGEKVIGILIENCDLTFSKQKICLSAEEAKSLIEALKRELNEE